MLKNKLPIKKERNVKFSFKRDFEKFKDVFFKRILVKTKEEQEKENIVEKKKIQQFEFFFNNLKRVELQEENKEIILDNQPKEKQQKFLNKQKPILIKKMNEKKKELKQVSLVKEKKRAKGKRKNEILEVEELGEEKQYIRLTWYLLFFWLAQTKAKTFFRFLHQNTNTLNKIAKINAIYFLKEMYTLQKKEMSNMFNYNNLEGNTGIQKRIIVNAARFMSLKKAYFRR